MLGSWFTSELVCWLKVYSTEAKPIQNTMQVCIPCCENVNKFGITDHSLDREMTLALNLCRPLYFTPVSQRQDILCTIETSLKHGPIIWNCLLVCLLCVIWAYQVKLKTALSSWHWFVFALLTGRQEYRFNIAVFYQSLIISWIYRSHASHHRIR